jgi:hypothetical protein
MYMRSVGITVTAVALMLFGSYASGQQMRGQAAGPGIGFRNDLKIPVIVQGVSLVNNMQRRGQPLVVQPGKTVWENNLAMGLRYYTIYEGNQQRILLRDRPVPIQTKDQFFAIRLVPGGAGQVKLDPEAVPVP